LLDKKAAEKSKQKAAKNVQQGARAGFVDARVLSL
jgi:hypothetical protein